MHILNAVEDENTPFRHDGREIRFTKVKATELISQPTAHEDEASSFTETILSTFQVFCFLQFKYLLNCGCFMQNVKTLSRWYPLASFLIIGSLAASQLNGFLSAIQTLLQLQNVSAHSKHSTGIYSILVCIFLFLYLTRNVLPYNGIFDFSLLCCFFSDSPFAISIISAHRIY